MCKRLAFQIRDGAVTSHKVVAMEMGMDGGILEEENFDAEVDDLSETKQFVLGLDLEKHANSKLVQSIRGMLEHELGVNSLGKRRIKGLDSFSDVRFGESRDPRLDVLKERINNFSLLENEELPSFGLTDRGFSYAPLPDDDSHPYRGGLF